MKKMYFLLLLTTFVSLFTYAQDDETGSSESDPASTTLTETNPFQSNNLTSRCPYCGIRHYPICKKCSRCNRYHTPNCNPPQQTPAPIDGGLSVLLVAGAAYGVKRMRRKNQ